MNREELKKYAIKRGFTLGQAEKDYFQHVILFLLYNELSDELIFKGGTALEKCYNLPRFSEDLDFTVNKIKNFKGIVQSGLDLFNIPNEIRTLRNEKKYMIKIEGPLFSGKTKTMCSVTLDLSQRNNIIEKPQLKTIGYHMDIIPAFDVLCMDESEIFSEKIRAVMTRSSARDIYDIIFLIKKGIPHNITLTEKKLELVELEFDSKIFMEKCNSMEYIWKTELKSLVRNVPDFKENIAILHNFFL